jgi:hypothetical protein
MSPKYTLNRKGWLAAELLPRYPSGIPPYETVERIAAGFCFDQFEQEARDRANLLETGEPKFPALSPELASALRG